MYCGRAQPLAGSPAGQPRWGAITVRLELFNIGRRTKMLKEFRDFIARGNVIDLAVAVIIGAAFGKLVTSLVEGIIMPPIGLLLGGVDFVNLFIDLSGRDPASLADAQVRGLPVIA